jgi:hypothetical protein
MLSFSFAAALWIAAAALVILVAIPLTESGHPFWPLVAIAAYVGAVQYFGVADPLAWITANPGTLAALVAAYCLAGCAWAVVRWWRLCGAVKRDFDEWASRQTGPKTFEAFNRQSGQRDAPPRPGDYAERITAWIALWPFSLLHTLLGDFVWEVFRALYERLAGVLQAISDKVFADVTPPH